jgi:dipeptidyl aminopeptidase/acylaminoacyl peptidase
MYDFARYLNIRSATSPVLAADGRRVAFLSNITGYYQVWSVPANPAFDDPWPRQLTFFSDKVWEIHGTSDSDHLIAVSDAGGNERQQFYLITNYGDTLAGTRAHDVRRLTHNDDAIHAFGAWSDDGQRIVYTCNQRNTVDFDIYEMDLRSGEARLLRECQGRRTVAAWIDDRCVLTCDDVASEQVDLYVLDMETGEESRLTPAHEPAKYSEIRVTGNAVHLVTDRTHDRSAVCRLDPVSGALTEIVNAGDFAAATGADTGEVELLAVAPDARTAAVTFNEDGYSRLFLLDLHDGYLDPVAGVPGSVIAQIGFSSDGRHLVFDLQTPIQPSDICVMNVGSRSLLRLTHSDRAGIDSSTFIEPELVHFESHDGLQIPAFVYRPRTEVPPGGFPCILYVHGGPAGQQRPDFDVRFQYFLNHGYALFVPNVRGSTGYGRRYMMLDDVERRMDSVADLDYAVRWLHAQPDIAPDRIAIYGRSYGGFMVLAALTEYPDRFAAGIDVVGIADWVTFLERTSAWRKSHREREYGSLETDRELLRSISPLHKAERIQAPLLVLAGDNDPRVPLFESEQIVERVREAGGVVQFAHYADEGHNFSKLENQIDSFTQMGDFLDRHLAANR